MTGVTANRALPVEVSLVDVKDHLNHPAGSEFGWLLVFIKLIWDVAVVALHAQRTGDESHRWL